ncbi:MAG TPA: prepilin-type N-terminal cleavage/methylation domain-containing protein [Anaeromyxobacter sp.]|nr:prepilin-type N-terminal cleavage/methylation domain-containing protein [Anaeromyxobacter sp.]
MTRARGFSLVELMIAMAITATIGAMTVGAFAQVDNAAAVARAQGERYAAARLALSRMAREVSMAFLSDNFDQSRFRDPVTLLVGRDDQILFSTMAHRRLYQDAKESDQAIVEYTVEADPDAPGEQALFRREKIRLDDEPDRGGRTDLVAGHVAGLTIAYWNSKRGEWVREWTTRSVDTAKTLPSRVRFDLEVKLADGRTERFVTEARIEVRTPLGF